MTLREQIKAASAKEMAARIAWEANPLRNTLQPMIAAKAEYQHLLMLADRAGMLLVIEDDAEAVRRMVGTVLAVLMLEGHHPDTLKYFTHGDGRRSAPPGTLERALTAALAALRGDKP